MKLPTVQEPTQPDNEICGWFLFLLLKPLQSSRTSFRFCLFVLVLLWASFILHSERHTNCRILIHILRMNVMAETGIFIKMTNRRLKSNSNLKINPIDQFTYPSKWQGFTYFLKLKL